MDNESGVLVNNKQKRIVIISLIVCAIFVIIGGLKLYNWKSQEIGNALCKIQNKKYVHTCGDFGCAEGTERCVNIAADYKKPCTKNSECSSGLCNPGVDVYSIPVKPTIAELKEKNPDYITGTCNEILVPKFCSENKGLVTPILISSLEEAIQKLEVSNYSLRERMNFQLSFFVGGNDLGNIDCGGTPVFPE